MPQLLNMVEEIVTVRNPMAAPDLALKKYIASQTTWDTTVSITIDRTCHVVDRTPLTLCATESPYV